MDVLGLTSTLRKLYAYVESLWTRPGAASLVARLSQRLQRIPWLAAFGRAVAQSRVGQATASLVRTFVWKDLRGDQIDLAALESDARPVLRLQLSLVLVSVALLLFLPLLPEPAMDVVANDVGVPRYPIVGLGWALLALSLGWGAFVVGAARANGWALLFVGAWAFWSWTSIFAGSVTRLPALAHGAIALAAIALARPEGSGQRLRFVLAFGAGFDVAGCVGYVTRARLAEPIVSASIGVALVVGFVLWRARGHSLREAVGDAARWLGLAIVARALLYLFWSLLRFDFSFVAPALGLELAIAALVARAAHRRFGAAASMPTLRAAFVVAGLFAAGALVALFEHGGAAFASRVALHMDELRAYAWAPFYFLGAGIAFKLLADTKGLVRPLDTLLPGRAYPIVALAVLGSALAFAWLPSLSRALAQAGSHLGPELYRIYDGALTSPLWRETWDGLRFALVAFAVATLYLAARGALDRERGLRLGFMGLLTFFAILEHGSESLAFAKAGAPRGVLTVALFGVWIVWLAYSVSARSAAARSDAFPAAARTALFGGGLVVFAASLLHRGLVAPSRLADEYFFLMFQGAILAGVPYFLYVHASRHFASTLPPWPRLFGAFALGWLARLGVHLVEKIVLAGGSPTDALRLVEHLAAGIAREGRLPADAAPASGLGELAILVGAGLALRLAFAAWRTRGLGAGAPFVHAATWLGYGVGALLPSLALPFLPHTLATALGPLEHFLLVDERLLFLHALGAATALLVAFASLRAPRFPWVGALLAGTLELAALAGARTFADELVSMRVRTAALVLLVGAAVGLGLALRRRLATEPARASLVPRAHGLSLAIGAAVMLAIYAALAVRAHAPVEAMLGVGDALALPARWKPAGERIWRAVHEDVRATLRLDTRELAEPLRIALARRAGRLAATHRCAIAAAGHPRERGRLRFRRLRCPAVAGPIFYEACALEGATLACFEVEMPASLSGEVFEADARLAARAWLARSGPALTVD